MVILLKLLYKTSALLLDYSVKGKIEGWISVITVTTTYYLISKALNRKRADKHISSLYEIFHICNIHRVTLEEALKSGFKDFEDAVQYQSAIHAGLDGILTRNKKDYKKSEIPIFTPTELLKALDT